MKYINILTLLISLTTIAAEPDYFGNEQDSVLLYEIGGGDMFDVSVRPIDSNLHLNTSNGINIGYSCGKFDISASFKNLMDGFRQGVDNATQKVVNTANAAVTSFPLLELLRAQPGLYSIFKEYQISAENDINIAEQSCQDFEAQISAGNNPYANYLQQSKLDFWHDEASSGNADIVKVNKESKEKASQEGAKSYGIKRGGVGKPPVKVIENTVHSGVNNILNRKMTDPTIQANVPNNHPINKAFPKQSNKTNSQVVADYVIDVIGEVVINNEQLETKVGKGLQPKLTQERENIIEEINNNQLGLLNTIVLQKIRSKTPNQQKVILSTIAHTEAIKRTIDKALIARQILLAGMQDHSDVANNQTKKQKITLLEKEIETLMFEFRVRKELTNDTIVALLKESTGGFAPKATTNDSNVLFK